MALGQALKALHGGWTENRLGHTLLFVPNSSKFDSLTPLPAAVNQAHENPLDGEQDEEGDAVPPLFVDPPQQKVERRTSVSQLPQDGQDT